jgi:hypothetical protein
MPSMKRISSRLLAALLTFLAGVICYALWPGIRQPSKPQPAIVASPTVELPQKPNRTEARGVCEERRPNRVAINQYPNYPDVVGSLEKLVARKGKAKKNTFYISKTESGECGGGEFARAYWVEDKSVIILHLPMDKEHVDFYWLYYKARIDLVREVVPTGKYENLGCCLVERDWADAVLDDCVSNGYKLVIVKARGTAKAAT